MIRIPKTFQYYPTIPLSDLSDLYSVGDNRLGTKKICIVSHLPKVLRIGASLPISNKYTLFIEETDQVDSILWSIKLYSKGELKNTPANLQALDKDTNEFHLFIDSAFYSSGNARLFDRMHIICEVRSGTHRVKLEIEHILVDMFDIRDMMNQSSSTIPNEDNLSKKQFISHPPTSNYLLNCLNDYVTEGNITWNKAPILDFNSLAERDNLLLTVIGVIYFNILNTFSMEVFNSINLEEFDNKDLKAHLNTQSAPAYDGNFKNGICQLPLYALNDAFSELARVPDFAIPINNPLYAILAGTGMFYESFTDFYGATTTNFMPPEIKDAKARVYSDKDKLCELYILTTFPKSSIKLTFILVKFLFECSKKNQCQECLGGHDLWPSLGFNQIQDHPDFWMNVLAHYFDGPSSEIKNFGPYVQRTYGLSCSPQAHFILHHAPRIVTAYFAKKIVKKTSVGLQCFFERIDSQAIRVDDNERRLADQPGFDSVLGRQLYLVVETLNCRDKELICSIKSIQLSGDLSDLSLMIGPNRWTPFPISNPVFEIQSSISVFVGQHDVLNNIAGNHEEYINVFDRYQDSKYNVDHVDKAIVKVNLRPDSQLNFTTWVNRLGADVAHLEIMVRRADAQPTYFGNDARLSISIGEVGQFLNDNDRFDRSARFRVVNRIVYEIFHRDNQYNFFTINAGNRKRVGKIANDFIATIPDNDPLLPMRQVIFFYHDQNDSEHELCICSFSRPPRRANGVPINATSNPENVPIGFTSDSAAPAGGDAFWNYYYQNGDIVTRDNPAAPNSDHGVIRYPLATGNDAGFVELVRMPDNLNKSFLLDESNRVTITFAFSNTQRRFVNPGCFAAFLGILAELNYQDVRSTGMCFGDATSYPSVSHPNGDSIDTLPLTTHARRVAIIAAFRDWGFPMIISGTEDMQDGANLHNAAHTAPNAHVHAQDYNENHSVHLITN